MPALLTSEDRDRIDVIRAEAERFAAVLADTEPAARCPTCPDWNAADLLWHLVEVHDFWARILAGGVTEGPDVQAIEESPPERPASIAEMLPMRERATAALTEQLEVLGNDEARWSWWDEDQTVGFTRRMQVCEATMHRVDAELTAGQAVSPIPTASASLAVQHCIEVMWGWIPDWASHETLAIAEFVASDTGERWLVDVGHWAGVGPESGKSYDEPHAVPAATGATARVTATAPAQDLARWAWTRGGEVRVTGEQDAVDALNRLISNGIQ